MVVDAAAPYTVPELLDLGIHVYVAPDGTKCDRCPNEASVRRRFAFVCEECHDYLKDTGGGYITFGDEHERLWAAAVEATFAENGPPPRNPAWDAELARIRAERRPPEHDNWICTQQAKRLLDCDDARLTALCEDGTLIYSDRPAGARLFPLVAVAALRPDVADPLRRLEPNEPFDGRNVTLEPGWGNDAA
jgi:hypothetical protein